MLLQSAAAKKCTKTPASQRASQLPRKKSPSAAAQRQAPLLPLAKIGNSQLLLQAGRPSQQKSCTFPTCGRNTKSCSCIPARTASGRHAHFDRNNLGDDAPTLESAWPNATDNRVVSLWTQAKATTGRRDYWSVHTGPGWSPLSIA